MGEHKRPKPEGSQCVAVQEIHNGTLGERGSGGEDECRS